MCFGGMVFYTDFFVLILNELFQAKEDISWVVRAFGSATCRPDDCRLENENFGANRLLART
jgi:hypothetical protein